MDRRVSSLDKYNLVSFSDPHSSNPWRLGREATIFDIKKLNYKLIINAIRTSEGLNGTIEANPAYGKYHIDGHRDCGVFFNAKETKKLGGICPKCNKPLTIGVEYRIEELSDRKEPVNLPEFKEVIPLHELIAVVYGVKSLSSKKVQDIYSLLIKNFNNEYNILLNTAIDELKKVVDGKLAKLIILNRENKLKIRPGYDGLYGQIILDEKQQQENPKNYVKKQKSLNEF